MLTEIQPEEMRPGDRVLVYSDLHLHEWDSCAAVDEHGVNTRLRWGCDVLDQIARYAHEHGARAVYCLGDLLHVGKERVPTAVQDLGFRALARVHDPAYRTNRQTDFILVGNHEQPRRHGELTALRPMERWPGVELVTGARPYRTSDRDMLFVAYQRDLAVLQADVKAMQSKDCLIFMHAGISGAEAGSEREWFLRDQELPVETFLDDRGEWIPAAVVSGHYHKAQVRHEGRVVYVGAPMGHRWSDLDYRGSVMLLNLRDLTYSRLPIVAPVFRKAFVKAKKDVTALKKMLDGPTFLRVEVMPGGKATPKDVRKLEAHESVLHLEVKDLRKEQPAAPRRQVVSSTMGDRELLERYLTEYPPGGAPGAGHWVAFDLETQTSAKEVGGWGNKHLMKVSVGVVFRSDTGEYTWYGEEQMPQLVAELQAADLVVGYNHEGFDYAVLQKYAPDVDLKALTSFDIMLHVQGRAGFRPKLDNLAQSTLGVGKSTHGLQAVEWWKEGKVQEIVEYCTQDVAVTADLFKYGLEHGHVLLDGGRRVNVEFPRPGPAGPDGPGRPLPDLLALGLELLEEA